MSQIKIVRIHNELLGTYGDQGNAEVLAFRARFHGITTTIVDVNYNDPLPTNGDIYLLVLLKLGIIWYYVNWLN